MVLVGAVISRELQEKGIKSPRGKDKWSETTILGIIKNEKYKGDILMGKHLPSTLYQKEGLIILVSRINTI